MRYVSVASQNCLLHLVYDCSTNFGPNSWPHPGRHDVRHWIRYDTHYNWMVRV
jgi:hypothetical protein